MRRVYFGVGTGFDCFGNPVTDAESKRAESEAIMARAFGGSTTYPVTGSWFDAAGTLVHESGIGLEAYIGASVSTETIRTVAESLKALWRQESVMLTVQPVSEVTFV